MVEGRGGLQAGLSEEEAPSVFTIVVKQISNDDENRYQMRTRYDDDDDEG